MNKIGRNTKPWGTPMIICFYEIEDSMDLTFKRSVNSAPNAWISSTACFHFFILLTDAVFCNVILSKTDW